MRSFTLDGSTIITSDQADDDTQRSNLSLSTTRFRSNRWLNSFVLGFESNDELGLSLRWELINDLFWDLNYYNTLDSNPPSGSESTNDYGIVTSIGYSF